MLEEIAENVEQNIDDLVNAPEYGGKEEDTTPNPVDPEVPDPEAYTPDLTYMLREEPKQMHEGLASIIKSKEEEDEFRQLYTRSNGLDGVQENLTAKEQEFLKLTEQHGAMDAEYGQFKKGMERLSELSANDLMAFQRHWKIDDQKILERAYEIIELQEKGVEAQQQHEQAFQNRQNQFYTQQQSEQVSARSEAQAQELHNIKLTQAMSAPDVVKFQSEFDSRMGVGAFEAAVRDQGSLQYHQTGRYVEPLAIVGEVYRRSQAMIPPNHAPAQNLSNPQEREGGGQNPANPQEPRGAPGNRLPNLGQGRPGTPVQRRVKTMADLKKLAANGAEY